MANEVQVHRSTLASRVAAGWALTTRVEHVPKDDVPARYDRSGRTDEITSPANPRVKWLLSLRKRAVRDDEGVTVVEGHDELTLALAAGVRPRVVVTCPELLGDDSDAIIDEARSRGAEVVTMGVAAFAKASYRQSPDGWLAVVPDPARSLEDLAPVLSAAAVAGRRPLLLVCEAVEKPGNLGAMLRTADAAGVDAVISASPVADWGNPNVVRASKGTLFTVPVAAAGALEVVAWLRSRGIQIVVATPETDLIVTELDLTRSIAIVVGAEHDGVSALWFDLERVGPDATAAKVPMVGRVNSLNVATSAAVAVYEAVRQRSG